MIYMLLKAKFVVRYTLDKLKPFFHRMVWSAKILEHKQYFIKSHRQSSAAYSLLFLSDRLNEGFSRHFEMFQCYFLQEPDVKTADIYESMWIKLLQAQINIIKTVLPKYWWYSHNFLSCVVFCFLYSILHLFISPNGMLRKYNYVMCKP